MKRLYLSIIITVVSTLLLLGWALDNIFEANTVNESNEELAHYHKFARGLALQLNTTASTELASRIKTLSEQFSVTLSLEDNQNLALPADLQQQLAISGSLFLESDEHFYILQVLEQHRSLLLQVNIPRPTNNENGLDLLLTLMLYGGLSGILILWLLPLTRRLSKLTNAALAFGNGNLNARVTTNKLSYLQTLEISFNRMANQIGELIAENKLLADSLSHDLRTPLACLRFGIDAALDETDITKKNHYIERLEQELTRMEEMLSAFLEYASIERHGFNLILTQFNINELIQTLEHDCQPLAGNKQLIIKTKFEREKQLVNADKHWLYRALLNLISNAINYGNAQILISVKQHSGKVSISIEDDGVGIPKDKQLEIFKPFTKLDKNRTRNQGNFGLGLAIVHRIADWHHATISVDTSTTLNGAKFTFTLPN